jgi:hypothetical protein
MDDRAEFLAGLALVLAGITTQLLVYACLEDRSCRKEFAERNQRPHDARARSAVMA